MAGEREIALAGELAGDGDHHGSIRRRVDARPTAARQVIEPEPLGRPEAAPAIDPSGALAEPASGLGAGHGGIPVEEQGEPRPLDQNVGGVAPLGREPGLADVLAGEAGLPLWRHAAMPIAHSRGRMA